MASYIEEQKIRAHLELIAEAGTYAGYFEQGTNADGDDSAWFITNDSDKAAADTLLDAKVAELTAIGTETAGYRAIHFDDSVSGADYRTWFTEDATGDYYKTDNGDSDNLAKITNADEIATLLTDSGYVVV